MARIDAFAHCSIWNRFEAAVDGESYTNQKGGDVLIRTDLLQLWCIESRNAFSRPGKMTKALQSVVGRGGDGSGGAANSQKVSSRATR